MGYPYRSKTIHNNDGRTKLFKGTNPFFPDGVLPISGFTDPNSGNFGAMGIFGGSTGGTHDYRIRL